MRKLFQYDSPFINWVNRMGRIVILNLLWAITSIPLLTIGASTAAMYRIAISLAEKTEDLRIFRDYFAAFRTNLKQGTLVMLILLVPIALIVLNLLLLFSGRLGTSIFIYIVCFVPVPPVLFILAYIFAYIALFEDKPMRTIINSSIISIANLPKTILMVILNLLPLILCLFATELFLRLLFVWLLFAFALIAYLNSKLLLKAFRPYLNETKEENTVDA